MKEQLPLLASCCIFPIRAAEYRRTAMDYILGKKGEVEFNLLSLRIGKLFLSERRKRRWNFEVSRNLDAAGPTTHAQLKKFEQQGLLVSQHERVLNGGRPERVFYMLTDAGERVFREVLGQLQLIST